MTARLPAPVALMGVIFYFSAQSDTGSELPEWARVVGHFTQFGLLAALWLWALEPRLRRRAYAVAGAISVLYAISDEYHQSFVPGRHADPFDVLIDSAGVVAVLLAARLLRPASQTPKP